MFIAEVCSNHNGDFNRALTLIDRAASIGCDAVKFQLFKLDSLFAPEVLAHPDYQFLQERREWELPITWLPFLAKRCMQRGVRFGCSPFYLAAVEELRPYVSFYKLASYQVLHGEILAAVGATGKPVIMSTGMATDKEIIAAAATLKESGTTDLTLLHCVSAYPANARHVSFMRLENLRAILFHLDYENLSVGWSDHTCNPGVIYAMWPLDAIEFHLDLEGKGAEFEQGHCWLPGPAQTMIETVKTMRLVWGNDSGASADVESKERLWRADPSDGLRPLKEIRHTL